MTVDSNRLRWGLVLLAVGIALVGAQTLFEYTRHYTAVDIPVRTAPTTIRTGPFTLNYPGLYLIEYRTARAIHDKDLRCRPEIEDLSPERCRNGQPLIATFWILRNDSGIVAQGDSKMTFAESIKGSLPAEIGEFQAGSFIGQKYSLDVTIRNAVQGLEGAQPSLVVELHPHSVKVGGALLFELLAFVAGTIFSIIGLVETARGIWEIAFDRRMDRIWSSKT